MSSSVTRSLPEVFAAGAWLSVTMASKKRQKCLKEKLQVASQVQMKKSDDKRHETASFEAEEEEDAFEMERNFAVFSERGSVQTSERTEEEASGEEDEDEDDEEDDESSEDLEKEQTDVTGSEEQRDSLSTMSFEEVIRLQSKLGTKACKKLIRASQRKRQDSEVAKHVTRNRPQEISAKKPVSFLRKVCTVRRPILRDPRFDDLSGEFKPEVFGKTYKFIDDIRQREAQMVRKRLKKVKSKAKKEELSSFLKRMENQKRNDERRAQQRENELSYKRKQRALVGHGHRPFYLKKSDKKKLQLAEKYSELKRRGKLENFLSKKRKRNAVKDRRKMP